MLWTLRLLAGLTALGVPSMAAAQSALWEFLRCTGLPGCGGGGGDVISIYAIPALVELLLQIVSVLSILYVIWAGIQMVISLGDETKENQARMSIMYGLMGLALAMSAGSIVSLVASENYVQGDLLIGPGSLAANIVRIVLVVFNAVVAVIIIWAGMRMVLAAGKSDEFQKGITILRAAIIGAIVVNLAKAIVEAFLMLPIF